jgi:hypothetical protein
MEQKKVRRNQICSPQSTGSIANPDHSSSSLVSPPRRFARMFA